MESSRILSHLRVRASIYFASFLIARYVEDSIGIVGERVMLGVKDRYVTIFLLLLLLLFTNVPRPISFALVLRNATKA